MTPVIKHTVELCECHTPPSLPFVPYERDASGAVRCSSCGSIPLEIPPKEYPSDHRIEIISYHRGGNRTRTFKTILHPD